jgi:hypothetical protein
VSAWRGAIPYFAAEELRCKGSGEIALDLRFAAKLPALRAAWGAPLRLTSVCRSPAHNLAVGGHPRSLHLTRNEAHRLAGGTMAADIAWQHLMHNQRRELYRLALAQGWACGLNENFLHIDLRGALGMSVVTFHYPNWTRPFPDLPI